MNAEPKIEPYLFFDGNCEEALNFYRGALGAELIFSMRYKESPEPPPPGMVPPGYGEKIMHACLTFGGTRIMASDACGTHKRFEGFSLSVAAKDEGQAKAFFSALSEGGSVEMPLTETFFSPCFGMLTDKFGVGWMVVVPAEP